SIHFTDGDDVKEGDLLFVIDPRPYEAKYTQAKADLESAQAVAVRAKSIFDRAVSFLRSQAVAQAHTATKKPTSQVPKASIVQAEAKVKEAKLNIDYTEIHAPFSGRISQRFVDIGNLVQPNATTLTTIYHYDPMYVFFTVSEMQHLNYMEHQREVQQTSSGK